MTVTARKYNPGFLTDDELVASFCVRTEEFGSMIESLRECTGSANTHQIVIGPRGSGKTSLLLRVAAEIRRDAGLSARFFPIVFAEESYEVSTAGEFWLESLYRLAEQAPGGEDGPDLRRSFEELRQIQDDRTLGNRCLAVLQDFADRTDKRLVLMVENLNMMLGDIGGDDAGSRLRHTLQTESRLLLLASATSRFEEIDSPDRALYDLFRVLTLRPLDRDGCATLWQAVAGQCRAPDTIRALRILTGGSPRLLTIVARFGANLSFRELMADLLNLVDDHTEYFRSHLGALPAQERRVYLALADLWKPATAKEIAERARLQTSQCSAQLKRLTGRGVVEVTGGTERRKLYYVAERLYNIYYLMRRARRPAPLVDALIRFMEAFYSPDELKDRVARMAREASGLEGEALGIYRTAFEQLVRLPSLEAYREELASLARAEFADWAEELSVEFAPPPRESELVEKATTLMEAGRLPEAIDVWDEVLERFGLTDPEAFDAPWALASLTKAVLMSAFEPPQEALTVYNEILDRFGTGDSTRLFSRDAAVIRRVVAGALFHKGNTLARMNRQEEAVMEWDEVIGRFGSSDRPFLQEKVAESIAHKIVALTELNRWDQALAACADVLESNGGIARSRTPKEIAYALGCKAAILFCLDRTEEALPVCEEVFRRFGNSDSPDLRKAAELALTARAGIELIEGQPQAAIVSVNRVLERDGKGSSASRCQAHMIRARAYLAEGDVVACERDIETALTVLPARDAFVKTALDGLTGLAIDLGAGKVRDLIRASPAADLLLPLTTALEIELGEEPRVAKEVEEVAEDILRDLEELRKERLRDGGTALPDPGTTPGRR